MLKIDVYKDYCLIWFDNFNNDVISKIIAFIDCKNFIYDLHNKSVTVYSPTYELLYELSELDYILLQ